MKNHVTLLLTLLLATSIISAQNLVPNPGFENYVRCPFNTDEMSWVNPGLQNWYAPTHEGTSDNFNYCSTSNFYKLPSNFFGYATPRTGNAYGGFFVYSNSSFYREYLQVQLTSPLTAGQQYTLQFYIQLADNCSHAIQEIGALLESAPVNDFLNNDNTPFASSTPQFVNNSGIITDTANWVLLSTTFTAAGGEEYLTIGNFGNDAQTTIQNVAYGTNKAYYIVDDVSLMAVLPVELTNFSGKHEGGANLLEWTTASETNNEYFVIERSPDGQNFTEIGRITGAGNYAAELNYTFRDNEPETSKSYYQLKQVDYDGSFTYSNVISIVNSSNIPAEFDVKQSDNALFVKEISGSGNHFNVYIHNLTGETVCSKTGEEIMQISLDKLPAGIYIISIHKNTAIFTDKLYVSK